jgi:hypothetical protein
MVFMKRPHNHKNGSGPPRSQRRPDDGNAFLPDNVGNPGVGLLPNDAEEMGEEFLASATGGDSIHSDANDEVVDEEGGGPFFVLDQSGQMPEEQRMGASKNEGHDQVQRQEAIRGARWASRGAR